MTTQPDTTRAGLPDTELMPCPWCKGIPKLCTHIESIGPYVIHDMQDERQTVCPLSKTSFDLDEWQNRPYVPPRRENIDFRKLRGIFSDNPKETPHE